MHGHCRAILNQFTFCRGVSSCSSLGWPAGWPHLYLDTKNSEWHNAWLTECCNLTSATRCYAANTAIMWPCYLATSLYARQHMCYSAYMLSPVRLSVCPSVTRVNPTKTVEVGIMKCLPHGSPMTLVFAGWVSSRNSKGLLPSGSVKQGRGACEYLENGSRYG